MMVGPILSRKTVEKRLAKLHWELIGDYTGVANKAFFACLLCGDIRESTVNMLTSNKFKCSTCKNTLRLELAYTHVPLDEIAENDAHFTCQAISAEDALFHEEFLVKLNQALNSINSRDEEVLRLHFGLDSSAEKTLQEVADLFSVTRERTRQTKNHALRTLKHPVYSRVFRQMYSVFGAYDYTG